MINGRRRNPPVSRRSRDTLRLRPRLWSSRRPHPVNSLLVHRGFFFQSVTGSAVFLPLDHANPAGRRLHSAAPLKAERGLSVALAPAFTARLVRLRTFHWRWRRPNLKVDCSERRSLLPVNRLPQCCTAGASARQVTVHGPRCAAQQGQAVTSKTTAAPALCHTSVSRSSSRPSAATAAAPPPPLLHHHFTLSLLSVVLLGAPNCLLPSLLSSSSVGTRIHRPFSGSRSHRRDSRLRVTSLVLRLSCFLTIDLILEPTSTRQPLRVGSCFSCGFCHPREDPAWLLEYCPSLAPPRVDARPLAACLLACSSIIALLLPPSFWGNRYVLNLNAGCSFVRLCISSASPATSIFSSSAPRSFAPRFAPWAQNPECCFSRHSRVAITPPLHPVHSILWRSPFKWLLTDLRPVAAQSNHLT